MLQSIADARTNASAGNQVSTSIDAINRVITPTIGGGPSNSINPDSALQQRSKGASPVSRLGVSKISKMNQALNIRVSQEQKMKINERKDTESGEKTE